MHPIAAFASRSPPRVNATLVEVRCEASYLSLSVSKFVIASFCSLKD
jgi:hypothetical protein